MNVFIAIPELIALAALGLVTAWLAGLSLLSFAGRRRAPARGAGEAARIAVVIPAHDEENTIGGTIRSIAALDYPAGRTRTFVVADNCTDATASVARSLDAEVLERTDAVNRGKGQALRWAFDTLLAGDGRWDGFVVIDADSVVSPNFLRVMDAHLADGADAVQASDLVAPNPASWSSEITRLGFTLYNVVRPLGRSVPGGSAGLRGNGMFFSARIFHRLPWNAFGVTEDLQYGLNLLLEGVSVRFAADAVVTATMPAESRNAESQRIRWEQGRLPVKRRYSRLLLAGAARKRSFALFDAWIDLVTPPFVLLMGANAAMLALHALLAVAWPAVFGAWLLAWAAVAALGLVHVVAGLASARADARLYLALLHVPRYALWKLLLRRQRRGSGSPEDWIRTTRETGGPDGRPDHGDREDVSITPHTHS